MEPPRNGWFTMENPNKVDGLGVTLFQETWLVSKIAMIHNDIT